MKKRHSQITPGRTVRKIALLLVLGGLLSVSIAWGVAAKEAWHEAQHHTKKAARLLNGGIVHQTCKSVPPGEEALVGLAGMSSFGFETWTILELQFHTNAADWPTVQWPRAFRRPPEGFQPFVSTMNFGWPLRSMQYRHRFVVPKGGGLARATDEFHSSAVVDVGSDLSVRLPLRPIWRGLVGNAAIIGALLGAIWFIPGAVRRAWRRRRGRCASCGYILAGPDAAHCPECGATLGRRGSEFASKQGGGPTG